MIGPSILSSVAGCCSGPNAALCQVTLCNSVLVGMEHDKALASSDFISQPPSDAGVTAWCGDAGHPHRGLVRRGGALLGCRHPVSAHRKGPCRPVQGRLDHSQGVRRKTETASLSCACSLRLRRAPAWTHELCSNSPMLPACCLFECLQSNVHATDWPLKADLVVNRQE